MSTPIALWLADKLEDPESSHGYRLVANNAADELRRLQQENEQLKAQRTWVGLAEAEPSQQAAQTALAWMRPSIYAECQPETTTLREVADEWIAEGHVVTALGPLSQAEWQELSDQDRQEVFESMPNMLEEAAKHFDQRNSETGGFYDEDEPAKIIRALKETK
jgi:hypothetical protein